MDGPRACMVQSCENDGMGIIKNNKMEKQVLVLANMVNEGKKFMVVQVPDWNGGHFFMAEPIDYELKDFEYIEWEGTPAEAATMLPSFEAHAEPLYEDAVDYTMSMFDVLKYTLK